MKLPRGRAALLSALVLGLLLRLGLVALAIADPERLVTTDGRGYLALARDLRAGYFESGSPQFARGLNYPPAYPAFAAAALRLTGDSPIGLALVQCLVWAATLPLLHALGRRIFSDTVAGLAVLLLALDPASAIYCVLSQPEALFTLLVAASALTWTHAQTGGASWALATGALAGLAMLVRPIGALLPLAIVATLLFQRPLKGRLLLRAGLVLSSGFLIGGAWVARNQIVTGTAFFAGIEGANGLYYRAAGALAMSEQVPVEVARMRLAEVEAQRGGSALEPAARIRLQTRLMLEVLASHPLGAARAALQGWLRLFGGTGLSALSAIRGDPDPEGLGGNKRLLNLLLALPLAVVLLGALRALVAAVLQGDRLGFVLPLAYLGYFLLTSSFLEANTRFRVPMAPFLCLIAARGWLGLLGTAPLRRSPRGQSAG